MNSLALFKILSRSIIRMLKNLGMLVARTPGFGVRGFFLVAWTSRRPQNRGSALPNPRHGHSTIKVADGPVLPLGHWQAQSNFRPHKRWCSARRTAVP